MAAKIRPTQPRVSWKVNSAVSYGPRDWTLKNAGDHVNLTVELSEAWTRVLSVHIEEVPGSGLVRGVDYDIDRTQLIFQPGDTEKSVKITKLDPGKFRETRDLFLVCAERTNKGAKGDFQSASVRLHGGTTAPPEVSFTVSEQSGDDEATYYAEVVLSAASGEDTAIPLTYGGTLVKDTDFTISGDDWDNASDTLTVPEGETRSVLEVVMLGTPGNAQLRINVPADNIQRNLLPWSNYATAAGDRVNEPPVLADEVEIDRAARRADSFTRWVSRAGDWVFGCDDLNNGFASLQETVEDVTLYDGSTGPALFCGPRSASGGAEQYGCIRKSFDGGSIGGWDYTGTLDPETGIGNSVHPDASIQEGHNIWSVYLKRTSAPAGFSLAGYTSVQILNRLVQAGVSNDPNPKDHRITLSWAGAVPSMYSTDNVDYYNIEDVGNDWYRISVVYDAPAAAAGDTTNWFVRPCTHPSDDVSLHLMEGVWIWGAQFEIDPDRVQTTPSAYQEWAREGWYAGLATMGSTPIQEITVV